MPLFFENCFISHTINGKLVRKWQYFQEEWCDQLIGPYRMRSRKTGRPSVSADDEIRFENVGVYFPQYADKRGYFLIHCIQTKITTFIFLLLWQFCLCKIDKEKDKTGGVLIVMVSLARSLYRRILQTIIRFILWINTKNIQHKYQPFSTLGGLGWAICPTIKLSWGLAYFISFLPAALSFPW